MCEFRWSRIPCWNRNHSHSSSFLLTIDVFLSVTTGWIALQIVFKSLSLVGIKLPSDEDVAAFGAVITPRDSSQHQNSEKNEGDTQNSEKNEGDACMKGVEEEPHSDEEGGTGEFELAQ